MLAVGTSKIAYKDAHEPAIDDLGTKSAATIQASGSPLINSICMRAVFFALAVTFIIWGPACVYTLLYGMCL